MAAPDYVVKQIAKTAAQISGETKKEFRCLARTLSANVLTIPTGVKLIEDVQCSMSLNTGVCTSFLAAPSSTAGSVDITAVGSNAECNFYVNVKGV